MGDERICTGCALPGDEAIAAGAGACCQRGAGDGGAGALAKGPDSRSQYKAYPLRRCLFLGINKKAPAGRQELVRRIIYLANSARITFRAPPALNQAICCSL